MTTKRKPQPDEENRRIDQLIRFPEQDILFQPCSAEEDAKLLADIEENGLKHMIEVLPANDAGYAKGTVIAGHRRLAALIKLGIEVICVIVRYDLANADRATIRNEFIKDNSNRRQLTKLDQVRIAINRDQLDAKDDPSKSDETGKTLTRDRIAKKLGLSGRTVQRLIKILQTPPAVQKAYEADQIGITVAEKVANLSKKAQNTIVTKIESGKDPKKVILPFLAGKRKKKDKSKEDVLKQSLSLLRKFNQVCNAIGKHYPSPEELSGISDIRDAKNNCLRLLGMKCEE